MADLKLKILGDFTKLRNELRDIMKQRFKLNTEIVGKKKTDEGASPGKEASGEAKKQTGLLGGILKGLLPLGILLSLKPVTDLLGVISGFVGLFFLLFYKWSKELNTLMFNLKVALYSKLGELATELGDVIRTKISDLLDGVKGFIEGVVTAVGGLPAKIWSYVQALPGKIWESIKSGYSWVTETLSGLKAAFLERVTALRDALVEKVLALRDLVLSLLDSLGALKDALLEKLSAVWDKIAGIGSLISDKLGEVKASIIEYFVDLKNRLSDKFKELKDKLVEKFDKVVAWLNGIVDRVKELKDKLVEKFDKVVDWLKSIVDRVKELPGLIGRYISNLASDIVDGIRNLNPFSRKESVDDAIIKPDGTIIRTNPNDTLIATQSPGSSGGRTMIFNFYGFTMDQAIERIKRELGSDQLIAGRY